MTKIYKLTYHATQVMHALFDKEAAVNRWQISSRALRDCVEYFGPRTESLSMDTKSGKAIFTSFTEKIMDGKGTSSFGLQAHTLTISTQRDPQAASRNSNSYQYRRL